VQQHGVLAPQRPLLSCRLSSDQMAINQEENRVLLLRKAVADKV
jgi:hypothetical protein